MQAHRVPPVSPVSCACALFVVTALLQACGGGSETADSTASSAERIGADASASAVRSNASAATNLADTAVLAARLPAVSEGQSFDAGTGKAVRYRAGAH